MVKRTESVRISILNKYIIYNYIVVNYQEKNKSSKIPVFDELITFLIRENVGEYYEKIKSESENELKYNKRV